MEDTVKTHPALEALVFEFRETMQVLEQKHPGITEALANDGPHRENAFLRFGNAAVPAWKASATRRSS